MRDFSKGLEQYGVQVMQPDVRELENPVVQTEVRKFTPHMVLCYDYGYLIFRNATEFIRSLEIPRVHYFADEPRSKYADSKGENLHSKLLGDEKILCWDKEYLSDFKPKGKYFPIFVDESKYDCSGREFNGYKYDISFVGRPLGEYRQEILANIIKNFGVRLKIFSYPAHFERSVKEMTEKLTTGELNIYKASFGGYIEKERDMASIYSSSRVNININLQGKESLNLRTYEVLASGGLLLSDRAGEFDECIEVYKNSQDIVEKTDYLLNNPKIAEKKVSLCRAMFLERYSLKIRARQLLSEMFSVIN